MRTRRRILALSLAICAIIAIAWLAISADVRELVREPEHVVELVSGAGVFAPIVYMAVSTLAFFFFANGPAVWLAAYVWSVPLAYAYALAATLGASFFAYSLAWVFGHEWAQQHIPPRLRRFEDRIEEHPFSTVLVLRMLLWANPLVDVFIAMSNVSTVLYIGTSIAVLSLTTAIQLTIALAAVEGMAAVEGLEAAGRIPDAAWAALALSCLVLFFAYRQWALRHAARRRGSEATAEDMPAAPDTDAR